MRNVYLSFLGLGTHDKTTDTYFYLPAVYEIGGRNSKETPFVQVAEMELLGGRQFDLVLIVATRKSHDAHFSKMKAQMTPYGATPVELILDEDFSSAGQWKWFEKILGIIEPGDMLTVDLTHGYRAVPITFSAAINFLQRARNISLNAVFYGAFDANRKLTPIVDMKDFYLINDWADAVGRLVDDADARKMSEVAERTAEFQAGELNDLEIIQAMDDLTDTIRNVDVNNVARKANKAIQLIETKKQTASETGKVLLNLVIDKFVSLTTSIPPTGHYDKDYFQVQIQIIRLLIEHKLFMQAYTVMREFIASLGMIPLEREGMNNRKRKKRRSRYGEVFIQMVQRKRGDWQFPQMANASNLTETDIQKARAVERLTPFFEELETLGIAPEIRQFAMEMNQFRNGFDHAWTAKSGASKDIAQKGAEYLAHLENALENMINENVFERITDQT